MTVRMRHTRAHTKNRRSHHALSAPAVSNEAQDGPHLRHRVSPITGTYKGQKILDLSKKEIKKIEKNKKKTEAKSQTEPVEKVKKGTEEEKNS